MPYWERNLDDTIYDPITHSLSGIFLPEENIERLQLVEFCLSPSSCQRNSMLGPLVTHPPALRISPTPTFFPTCGIFSVYGKSFILHKGMSPKYLPLFTSSPLRILKGPGHRKLKPGKPPFFFYFLLSSCNCGVGEKQGYR